MKQSIQVIFGYLRSGCNIEGFQIASGEQVSVVSRCDMGKSQLCLGLLDYDSDIKCSFIDIDSCKDVAYIPTNPYYLFSGIKPTLQGEIELSYQFNGLCVADYDDIVRICNLEELLLRDPFTLSGGEAVRAAIAIEGVRKPKVWILDQIYDWLFPELRMNIRRILKEISGRQTIILETHSILPSWSKELYANYILDGNGIEMIRSCDEIKDLYLVKPEYNRNNNHININDKIVSLRVKELQYAYKQGTFELGPISFECKKGSIVSIEGENGAGKSTLLRCLSLLHKPDKGIVIVNGIAASNEAHIRPKEIFYCFQEPDNQLYKTTVKDEIRDICCTLCGEGDYLNNNILEKFGLRNEFNNDPLTIARPKRRLLMIATGLLVNASITMFDEPTAGLDGWQRTVVAKEIVSYAERGGTALIVSHDEIFLNAIATGRMLIKDGKILF